MSKSNIVVEKFSPEQCIYKPELNSRKEMPSAEDIQALAESISKMGQVQPGVVRRIKGTQNVEVLAGRTRCEAVKLLNSVKAKDEEPYYFLATVTEADDKKAIMVAVAENEKRFDTNVMDRAITMQRMVDLGFSQVEVADAYGITEGRVSQIMKLNKLAAKYQKMIQNGDIQPDAAEVLASIHGDNAKRDEIIEDAISRRKWFDELTSARTEEEEEAAEETEAEPAKGKKEAKKADKKAAAKKGAKKKGVVTKEDVKVAAKKKGEVKGPALISMSSLIKVLESLGKDDVGPSACNIAGKLLEFIASEVDLNGLKKSLRYNTGFKKEASA